MNSIFAVIAALTIGAASAASAQLPSASTRALGMGDNYTAAARGYASVSWNPAALAMPGNPRASLTLLPFRAVAGLDPVTLGDIADYSGEFVPGAVREAWLRQIEAEGSEQGTGGGDVTLLAAQLGHFAVHFGSSMRAVSNISPGGAELLLFGNYGRTQEPRALDLEGSNLSSYAASTIAASYAIPLGSSTSTSRTSIGVTAKYTIGHLLLFGEDRGTTFTPEPAANINFPLVGTSLESLDGNVGAGFGVDAGVAMTRGNWSFGATIQNIINTFSWDEDKLVFRSGVGSFDIDTHTSDFNERDFASAPAELRQLVDDAGFKPLMAAGIAFQAAPSLTIVGDFRARLGETTLQYTSKTHVGVGAEYRITPLLPLRAGAAIVEGGYQLAAGVGLNVGVIDVSLSAARRNTDLGIDTITMLTLLSTAN